MTPNILKPKGLPAENYDDPNHPRNQDRFNPDSIKQKEQSNQSDMSGRMDGDHSAKTMDAAANMTTNATDFTDGIHEDANQKVSRTCCHYTELTRDRWVQVIKLQVTELQCYQRMVQLVVNLHHKVTLVA